MDTNKLWTDTQWARQSSEFAPETEGTDTVLKIGGTAVAQALGDRLHFILKSHRHHQPTDCTQASQISLGQASGDRLLFQSPSVHGKDTSQPRKIHMGERR